MWELAKIKEIKRGRDGEIRNATIKLPNGKLLNRSVKILYPLEINNKRNTENQSIIFDKSVQEVEQEESIVSRTRNVIKGWSLTWSICKSNSAMNSLFFDFGDFLSINWNNDNERL